MVDKNNKNYYKILRYVGETIRDAKKRLQSKREKVKVLKNLQS